MTVRYSSSPHRHHYSSSNSSRTLTLDHRSTAEASIPGAVLVNVHLMFVTLILAHTAGIEAVEVGSTHWEGKGETLGWESKGRQIMEHR